MSEAPNYMALHGTRLVSQGYSILPIMPGSKKPGKHTTADGWQNMVNWSAFGMKPPTAYQVNLWAQWPGAGIGILTGKLVGVDIDILDEEVAAKVRAVFERVLGITDAVRIGLAPKTLLVYRTREPFKKISRGRIEILGDGQQFVAYATHPDTGRPYSWPKKSLVDMHHESIPVVTEAQVQAAVTEAYELVPEHLKVVRLATQDGSPADARPNQQLGTPEAVESAAESVPNPDLSWDEWNKIGMAIYAGSGGKDFEAFDAFSKRSAKYNAVQTMNRWHSYKKSPPRTIGAGTLYKEAAANGWSPPAGMPLNESKRLSPDIDFSGMLEKGRKAGQPVAAPAPKAEKPAKGSTAHDDSTFPSQWYDSPSLVGEVYRWIIGCARDPQPTFALANAICFLGTLYGRRYRADGWNTRTNTFFVAIAKTAAGKDHSRECISELAMAAGLGDVLCGNQFTSGAAIISALGVYPSRISHMDELGKYLQAIEGKNAGTHQKDIGKKLLELYSASSGVYLGQEYANNKITPRIDLVNPNFNIFGTTTPETLIPALSASMAEDGTLGRIFFVPSPKGGEYPPRNYNAAKKVVPPDLVAKLKASWSVKPPGSGNLSEQQNKDAPIRLIDVTWDMDVEMRVRQISEEIERPKKIANQTVWMRLVENTIKLAMIEAISLDPVAPVVTMEILEMALAFACWSVTYTEALMSEEVAENEHEAGWKKVLAAIKAAKNGMTKSEVIKRFNSIPTKRRNEIIADLLEAGEITSALGEKPARGVTAVIYRAA